MTIVIALILAILCSSLILAGYYNKYNIINAAVNRKLVRNEESVINLLLSDTTIHCNSTEEKMDLFGQDEDSVIVRRGTWGLFQFASVFSFQTRFKREKSFFYGTAVPGFMDACLYLADHQKPVSLIGNTKLKGNAYLSKAGIKPGYIDQRGFNFSSLIEGKIKNSYSDLPAINQNMFACLLPLLSQAKSTSESKGDINVDEGDSIIQHFRDTALYIFRPEKIILRDISLKGQIIISSTDLIEVSASANLEDVILVAPRIRFHSQFEGTVQAIASDSLILEAGCVLNYPSSLVLIKQTTREIQNVLKIAENCTIRGTVVVYTDQKDIFKSYVETGDNTKIEGIMYTSGYLFLRGEVDGIVLTDYFIYKSPSTIYENHLVDVELNRNKLSPYFAGATIFDNTSPKKVIKWLH